MSLARNDRAEASVVGQANHLYACLHAPEFPLQAMLRLRHALRTRPVAVLEGQAPLERVCAASKSARCDGVVNGMTRVEAESFAGMHLLRRSLREEAEAKAALLSCASKYTPAIEDASAGTSATCVLDLTGTEKLFGAPLVLAERLAQELRGFGLHASIAMSANFHAASAQARAGAGITLIAPGQEQQALAPLLLDVLPLTEAQVETLALWGIRTLGGVAALPERALVARMGQAGKQLRLLARGEQPHLFQPETPAFELRESYEFDSPVTVMDSLLFVLAPMLEQLLLRARERALSLASVRVLLHLETSQQQAVREHRIIVRPALPTEDRKLLLKLLQLELDAHPPPAAVLSLEVTAEPGDAGKVQLGLFSPQTPESSRLDVTLARLRRLVGDACVGSPKLKDTHAPDSFVVEPFVLDRAKPGREQSPGAPAVRRIRPPAPLTMQTSGAVPSGFWLSGSHYQVVQAIGPWRASGAWWNAMVWSSEEWELIARQTSLPNASGDPQQVCCLVARDLLGQQWLLEAFYD